MPTGDFPPNQTLCQIDENAELRRRVEALERRVLQLERTPMSGGILGPKPGNAERIAAEMQQLPATVGEVVSRNLLNLI